MGGAGPGARECVLDVVREWERHENFFLYEDALPTLAELCREHGLRDIDFLKVDVEGAEADVLKSGDWKAFRPKAVVVEAIAPGSNEPSWKSWEPFLLAQGYRFMLFDTLNRFYVADEATDVAARFPRERAAWDSVRHMYEIGRAPENASDLSGNVGPPSW